MPNEKIRVVIVDDHPGVRAGIKNLLRRAKDIMIVGEGGDGMKAIELASTKKPDILLLDVELPIVGGDIAMRRIHDAEPDVRVLVVSTYNDRTYVQSLLANGAAGYITKDEAPAMLLEAIHSVVANKERWMSPRALEFLRHCDPGRAEADGPRSRDSPAVAAEPVGATDRRVLAHGRTAGPELSTRPDGQVRSGFAGCFAERGAQACPAARRGRPGFRTAPDLFALILQMRNGLPGSRPFFMTRGVRGSRA